MSDLIKGEKLFIYLDTQTKPIAFATSCSLEMSFETIDTSNKQSGNWVSNLLGKGSWTINSESLVTKKTGEQSVDAVFTAMTAREAVKVTFAEAGASFAKGTVWYEGNAYITSCNITAENDGVVSMSITFTGCGELAKGAAPQA